MTINTLKFFRYIWIYGLTRTIVKAIGRLNIYFPLWIFTYIKIPHNNKKNVAIIGCGQFSFSTITFFLSQSNKVSIKWCSDQSMEAARLLSKSYGINFKSNPVKSWLEKIDKMPSEMTSSMFYDFKKNKRLELRWLSGSIVNFSKEKKVDCPTHLEILNGIESK